MSKQVEPLTAAKLKAEITNGSPKLSYIYLEFDLEKVLSCISNSSSLKSAFEIDLIELVRRRCPLQTKVSYWT